MRLTHDVVMVGGGSVTGFGLSADFDAHVYLLDGGDAYALVDCGMGSERGMPQVLARIAGAGVDPAGVRALFLTHFHTDHAGGAARFRDRLGLEVAIGRAAQPALEQADHAATQFGPARDAGVFPADYEYPPCPVGDPLDDGDVRTVGRLTIRYIATPGHCAGHGSYLVTGGESAYLLAGDAVFAGGKLFLQATPDCDVAASIASLRRLAEEEFTALLPGHGPIALDGGRDHLDMALATVDQLRLPGSVF
jgi:glyoxylase-like metal-dependent hydrolase (beta-lactamase superfamily II)